MDKFDIIDKVMECLKSTPDMEFTCEFKSLICNGHISDCAGIFVVPAKYGDLIKSKNQEEKMQSCISTIFHQMTTTIKMFKENGLKTSERDIFSAMPNFKLWHPIFIKLAMDAPIFRCPHCHNFVACAYNDGQVIIVGPKSDTGLDSPHLDKVRFLKEDTYPVKCGHCKKEYDFKALVKDCLGEF